MIGIKKGQLDQPFLYIFAIVVIAFILLFGLKYIGKTEELAEKAAYTQFKADFQDATFRVYNKNPGTLLTFSPASTNKPLKLPAAIKDVCFQVAGSKTKIILNHPEYPDFSIQYLQSSRNNLCIPALNHQLSFTLENKLVNKETIVELNRV